MLYPQHAACLSFLSLYKQHSTLHSLKFSGLCYSIPAVPKTLHRAQTPFILLFKGVPNNVRGPFWKWRLLQGEKVQKGELEG